MTRGVLRAAMLSLPPAGIRAESLPDPASPGARVLVQYCTLCHALPSPAVGCPQTASGRS